MKISLSLCLSFFTSSYLPFLLFRVSHMGSLYVLMSKSDHLHDLAICVSWFCSFPSAGPVPRRLYSFLVSLSVLYHGMCGEADLSLSSQSTTPMASRLNLFSFAYICCFLAYRKRIHSAPLLRLPSPLEPSRYTLNPNADVTTNDTNASKPSNTVAEIDNATDIDVSVTVSRHDF
jgi:hypothetical protein